MSKYQLRPHSAQTAHKVSAISIGDKDIPAFNASYDHMLQKAGYVYAWLAWHGGSLA